jgi:hypothetical protein
MAKKRNERKDNMSKIATAAPIAGVLAIFGIASGVGADIKSFDNRINDTYRSAVDRAVNTYGLLGCPGTKGHPFVDTVSYSVKSLSGLWRETGSILVLLRPAKNGVLVSAVNPRVPGDARDVNGVQPAFCRRPEQPAVLAAARQEPRR